MTEQELKQELSSMKKNDLLHLIEGLMQEAKDNGWANISQEDIDKSKWNK